MEIWQIFQKLSVLMLILSPQIISLPTKQKFKVSVVEYYSNSTLALFPNEILARNSENMANIISEAANENINLIVFPENSFSTHNVFATSKTQTEMFASFIPEPEMRINLCTLEEPHTYRRELVKMSCAAKQYEMFVVMNAIERYDTIIFSSNIVFDPTGLLIAKCKKDLYTGQQFSNENCIFRAGPLRFALIMENNLLRSDLINLMGDADNVIYTAQEAGNNTVFPSEAFYEMMTINYNIKNLLVSTFNERERALSRSGIFSPLMKNNYPSNNIQEPVRISAYLEPTRRFKRSAPKSSRFIRSIEDLEIQHFKIGNHIYCGSKGLCCKISTLENYEPKYFSVAVANVTKDISKLPKYDKLKKNTMYTFNFCGIIYCMDPTDPSRCGMVPSQINEVPKVKIELGEGTMLPLMIGHDLKYEINNENNSKHVLEVTDSRKLLIIGFTNTIITYENVWSPRRNPKPITYGRNSSRRTTTSTWGILLIIIPLSLKTFK